MINKVVKKLSFLFVVEKPIQNVSILKKKPPNPEIDDRGNYIVNGSFRNGFTSTRYDDNEGESIIRDERVEDVTPSYLVVLEK